MIPDCSFWKNVGALSEQLNCLALPIEPLSQKPLRQKKTEPELQARS